MKKSASKAMSVVTVRLKVEPWQADVINKRLETCRKVYNAMLGYKIKQYGKMTRDPRWIDSKSIIDEEYKAMGDDKKKTSRLKDALNVRNDLLKGYGFSEFAFIKDTKTFYKDGVDYSNHISSSMAGISIAKPMWAAYQRVLFNNGKKVHYKKYGEFTTVASDGKSGLRLVNDQNETISSLPDNGKMWALYGTNKGKVLRLPVVIDDKDVYAKEALSNPIKIVRINRVPVKNRSIYELQLTVEGLPPVKYDKETGEIKHPVGKGKVGIYIDTKYATVCTKDGVRQYDLSEGILDYEEMRSDVNRYLDTSRRISNPDNYNEDGTIKHGIMENGKRIKLKWNNSNNYYKGKAKLSELYRKERVQRKLQREILSNILLAMGDEFVVNDYPFQLAAMRKQEDEKYPDGRNKSKKKAGKIIGQNAPATLVALLDQKLKSRGYNGINKIKLKNIDYHTENYREHLASQLYTS